MPRSKGYRVQTAVQAALGAGVLAGLVWLGWQGYTYASARAAYDEIAQTYTVTGASAAQTTQGGAPQSGTPPAPALQIDFAALQAQYPDAVAWLAMDDLEISYPVMHRQDNDYYLHRAPDGSYSGGGSLFMDCNNTAPADSHVLIYGHHMQDGSMFGTLDEYTSEAFYQKGSGTFTLYSADGARRYQIFSIQRVGAVDDIYSVGFAHDQTFEDFLQTIKAGSLYDTGVAVSAADQVVTLSTCATVGGDGRLVISAKALPADP